MNNKLVIKKVIHAPHEKVWSALTEPEQLKQWWGPDNVTIPECEVDLRIPGKFYIVMEAGEGMGQYKGTKWPMLAAFTLIESHTKLSYDAEAWTEGQREETMIHQTTDIMLTEENGNTTVHITAMIHKTGPKADMAVEGMHAGFTQELEKLNTFLTSHT